MRFLAFPFFIFALSILIMNFNRVLGLREGKTWISIGKQIGIAAAAAVIAFVVSVVIVVFFN